MGILDFAKDIGRQVFDRDDLAADNIKEMLNIKLSPIKDLTVEFDDGTVTLSGECMDQRHREQAILLAGNVKGVAKVSSDDLTYPAQVAVTEVEEEEEEKEKEKALEKVEFYEIKSGDTLSAIAKAYYGDFNKYPQIFEANREVIEDPDKIYPGQKIRIPLG